MARPVGMDKLKAGIAKNLAERGLAPPPATQPPPVTERPVTSTDRISAGVKKHFAELAGQAGRPQAEAERLDRFAPGSSLDKINRAIARRCESEEQRAAREASEKEAERSELDDAEAQLSRALEAVRQAKARFELTPADVAVNKAAGLGPQ